MDIAVKSIINIFTIIDGKINLLVDSNNNLLEIECFDNLELVCSKYIKDNIDINDLDLKQCYTFSEKSNIFNLKILYIDIVNIDNINLNNNFKFVELDKLDTNNIYIEKSIDYLKKELVLFSTLKKLYPSEFVLPEIQKIYENLLGKKYDRRNFRKRLIKLDIIEDINKYSSNKTGRPAKLYKFKDLKEDKILF
jgi:8-oxo-dGTP diphosphatase